MTTSAPRTLFGTTRFEQWCAFHRANPQVYDLFREVALQRYRDGYVRYGARAVWEHLRWHLKRIKAGSGEFKLNNIFAPYYARLLMLRGTVPGPSADDSKEDSDGVAFFETRDSHFDVTDEELLETANTIDMTRDQ